MLSEGIGEFAVLQYARPGGPTTNIGVLLFDRVENRLYYRLRDDWQHFAAEADVEILSLLAEDFEVKIEEMGAQGFLSYLEDTLSNVLRISERKAVPVADFRRTLSRLFEKNIGPVT